MNKNQSESGSIQYGLFWWLGSKEYACNSGNADDAPLGQEDPLEQGMATHSGVLAWRIPWMEKLGGLQSMGLHRVGHD